MDQKWTRNGPENLYFNFLHVMKYYFYIDETGEHSLSNINEDFPYFLLCGILISDDENKKLIEQVNSLKYDFFGTTEVILHSRDIRKCDAGIQLADLCAYPIVSRIRSNELNPAYEILKNKFYQKGGKVYGLKIHP